MTSKSYVTIEAKVCPVCGKEWKTDTILMHKRLVEKFEMTTVTGYDLCPDDEAKYAEGFIALVEAKDKGHGSTAKIHEPHRTGRIAHMKFEAAKQVFTTQLERDGKMLPMVFIDQEAYEKILSMRPEEEKGNGKAEATTS